MLCYHLFLFLFVVGFPSISTRRHDPFYRKDYTYIKEYDAFYKIHWDLSGVSWNSAFLTCNDEEAMLFYPKVDGEWKLVKNLTHTLKELPNVTDVFVGLHDEYGVGEFLTVDGHSTQSPVVLDDTHVPGTDCILMDMNTGEYKIAPCTPINEFEPLPYVCKKVEDESCPTIDKEPFMCESDSHLAGFFYLQTTEYTPGLIGYGESFATSYKYIESLKKCYKINNRPKMWQEAMQTCVLEGGILAVPENTATRDYIRKFLRDSEGDSSPNYFIGAQRIFQNGDYFTVKGKKCEGRIYYTDYNGIHEQDDEQKNNNCISIDSRSDPDRMYATECGLRRPFICEMEVTSA